jgi:DGQHR domain-containing protein
METIKVPVINIKNQDIDFYLCKIKAKYITTITYVARRREHEEEGAVQRILNKTRISSIKDYLINGGYFPNNMILNFVGEEFIKIGSDKKEANVSIEPRIVQVIDGQHRIEGLREAIKSMPSIGEIEFPILFSLGLTTAQCAQIFININTEQKVVPKSLIYDLYGLLNVTNRDYSIDRAGDIAKTMNEEKRSPYNEYIKFPSAKKFKGGIQLSTFVNNLKVFVKEDGEFSKYSINTLEAQTNTLINYFSAIEKMYGKEWDSLKNPFLYASGFGAALDILENKILALGFAQRKFSEDFFKSFFKIEKSKLPILDDIKGLSGESARLKLKDKLLSLINLEETREEDIEF